MSRQSSLMDEETVQKIVAGASETDEKSKKKLVKQISEKTNSVSTGFVAGDTLGMQEASSGKKKKKKSKKRKSGTGRSGTAVEGGGGGVTKKSKPKRRKAKKRSSISMAEEESKIMEMASEPATELSSYLDGMKLTEEESSPGPASLFASTVDSLFKLSFFAFLNFVDVPEEAPVQRFVFSDVKQISRSSFVNPSVAQLAQICVV